MHRLHKSYGIMALLTFGLFLSIAAFKVIAYYEGKSSDGPTHAELAAYYYHRQNYSNAVQEMDLALQKEPHNRAYLCKMAEYRNAALENQLQKEAHEKKEADGYYKLASYQYGLDKLEQAYHSIERAIGLNPKNSNYWKLSAFIAAELGKNEAEIAAYRKVVALDPKNRQAIHALTCLAPGAFELGSGILPNNLQAVDFVSLAESAHKSENFAEAITLYQLGLKFFPHDESLWKGIARSYRDQKDTRAVQAYEEAVKKSPKDDRILAEYAQLLLEKKSYAEALALMERAVELKQHNVDYLRQLAHLANLQEDYSLSQYTYTQILKLEAQDREALFCLPKVRAWAKERCGKGKEAEVVHAIHRALEDEDLPGAKQQIHLYENLYGKTLESTHYIALLSFKEMIKKEPNNADHWYRLARLYDNKGEGQKALAAIDKAVVLKPKEKEYSALSQRLEEKYCPQPPVEQIVEVTEACSTTGPTIAPMTDPVPIFMSSSSFWGSYYHESTSLTQTVEAISFDCTAYCGARLAAGVDLFQTKAKDKFIAVMGLGNYAGVDGQTTGSAEAFWVGLTQCFPVAQSEFYVGAEHEQIQGLDRWTPCYEWVLSSINGALAAEFFSSYGYYLVSPCTLSLKLRQWCNALFLDYAPTCNTHLVASVEVMANSDSNKQVDIVFSPQKSLCCGSSWEFTFGLLGNLFFSRHEFQHGYYSPHHYQAYGGICALDYCACPEITFSLESFLGTQRDSFSSFWGPLFELEFIERIDFCCDWHLDLFGNYSYLRQSRGSFNAFLIGAELLYQY